MNYKYVSKVRQVSKMRNKAQNRMFNATPRGIKNAQRTFIVICITSAIGCLFLLISQDNWAFYNFKDKPRENNQQKNYFLDVNKVEELGLIVNTSNCKIPDFSPWDSAMIPFIHKAELVEDCRKTSYSWSYSTGKEVIINRNQMHKDGYSFTEDSCCYKIIRRIKQPDDSYDKDADNLISYSTCIPIIKERTEITEEYIMIECSWKKVVVAYRAFHAFANFGKSRKVHNKINFWKDRRESSVSQSQGSQDPPNGTPPNILVIGLDSTSRLNFRRNMFKTMRVLETLGAVEMMGHTKVGENTFPNYCSIFTGYSEEDLQKICYFDRWIKQDDCPSIWKRLDAANYLTAHTEDAPDFTGFNYMKTGFVQQPVDFYSRPLFLAAHDYGYAPFHVARSEHMDCIGPQTNDEAIVAYLESTLDTAIANNTPIFTFSWSTTLSHGDGNMIQLSDDAYAEFLQKLIDKNFLENTILFFMGDHGYRYGPSRETLIGYFEDKLPNMWISLPPWIKQKFPQWQDALEINSRRLTSPFTFHWTFNLILDTFTSANATADSFDSKSGTVIPQKHRQNFFEPVPESNTCSDVGVPENYCACYPLQTVALDDALLIQAANVATNKLNGDYGDHVDKCAKLQVSKITAGAIMDKTSTHQVKRYIVGFVTIPGEFLFEAEVDYFIGNSTFNDQPSVQRANKINQDFVQCAQDPKLELICYCLT